MKRLLLVLLLLLTGCGRLLEAPEPAGLCDELGHFPLGDYEVLEIEKTPDDCIVARITDEKGHEFMVDDTRASLYQRWCYYWEPERNVLWFWSSDIGGHKWKQQPDRYFLRSDLDKTDAKEMPLTFWQALPGSIQERWQDQRPSTSP